MKKAEILEEVIGDLIDKGYPLGFDTAGDSRYIWQALNGYLTPQDFHIDEVHCCQETEDGQEIILVIAISIIPYHIKGILTSELLIEDSQTIGEIIDRLGLFFNGIKSVFKGWPEKITKFFNSSK